MSRKFTAAIPVSIMAALLHAGCCLLPMLLAGFGNSMHFYALDEYKPVFTFIQIVLVIYLGLQFFKHRRSGECAHGQVEKWSYAISLGISVTGLAFGLLEPLRTENQQLARQRFEYFKNHRQVLLSVEGDFDQTIFLSDLQQIQGVKPASVKRSGRSVSASYLKNETSKTNILRELKNKGYQVVFLE